MKKIRNLLNLFIGIFLLSISITSANVLVGGTVYNGSPNNPVSGAEIIVFCDSESLETTSLKDGTYAVVFDRDTICSYVNSIEKNGMNNTTKITVYIEDDTTTNPGSGKKTSGKIYQCGNGICDSGESSDTCLRDCPIQRVETNENNPQNQGNEQEMETINLENQNSGQNSGITGAVIGEGKSGSGKIFLIVLGILLGLGILFFILSRIF